jgi:hypothetical protein
MSHPKIRLIIFLWEWRRDTACHPINCNIPPNVRVGWIEMKCSVCVCKFTCSGSSKIFMEMSRGAIKMRKICRKKCVNTSPEEKVSET